MKNISIFLLSLFTLTCVSVSAQEWMLKLSSNVELRTWTLTSNAQKSEKPLSGATITLLKGTSIITQTMSQPNGDFVIDVPPNDDFMLTVSYPGCNTKKFFVTTKGVPEDVGSDNYKPTFGIGGFVMAKPFTGVDYIGLSEPLVKVEYKSKGRNFNHDEVVTDRGLDIVSKIYNSENSLIQNFCNLNKLGDEALRKKNCPLAKDYYTKAKNLIPDEQYPTEQLLRVDECLKERKEKEEIAKEEAAAKAEEAKKANEKAIAERQAKEKAAFDKAAAESAAKQKSANAKSNKTEDKNSQASAQTSQKNSGHTSTKSGSSTSAKTFSYQTNDNNEVKKNHSTGNSKHKIPAVIGADRYKENIVKADDYFKTKRYAEAKSAYLDALEIKANDPYATKRIAECDKLLLPK